MQARASAPVRVLDAGGWTDTWFAGHGAVCHLAVAPGTEAEVNAFPDAGPEGQVVLNVPAFRDSYRYPLRHPPGHHPLLETAIRRWAGEHVSLEVTVRSMVPPGSGLGTSASVVVALVAALATIFGGEEGPEVWARSAHQIETVDMGRQSGVQDQVAAASGGANLIEITQYPQYHVRPLELAATTWALLAQRVVTIYLGSAHDSSALHQSVVNRLSEGDRSLVTALGRLTEAAARSARALEEGDLSSYGLAMADNTEAQGALHPGLINPSARQLIEIARRAGALGWKVNGAGGPGGTLSILGPEDPTFLLGQLDAVPGITVLRLAPCRHGARIIERE